ncbi:late embryogenesis abundant protein At1g64065-like [Mercurialis annua]|uniref:late embryogenesis abundant protein At1g64065-like n=1 Tax=Mercurialis annua TaxID=3986 RepID=UPI00215E9B90|nr:late embryogenesis abundant protein At1g64065-like [Mercurialis annua]
MAEKEQPPHPFVSSPQNDDAETAKTKELTKKKRIKCIAFIAAFTIFQTGILLLFIFTVFRFKNPKFRVISASFDDNFQFSRNISDPFLNITMNTKFGVKNTNFGHFKYDISNVTFEYRGNVVGVISVDKARARARSTRKFDGVVVIKTEKLNDSSELSGDISSGKIPVSSSSRLHGKIHLMKLIKKKKSAEMNCTMNIDLQTRTLQDVMCK